MQTPETYAEFVAMGDALDAQHKQAARDAVALAESLSPKPWPMNLTPDSVKANPDYRAARDKAQALFAELRAFNGANVKRFKAEIRKNSRTSRG